MYEQHLSKFDLMRLIEKDKETRQRIAEIGGGPAHVNVDGKTIKQTTDSDAKLYVNTGLGLEITDTDLDVKLEDDSPITKSVEGLNISTDNVTIVVEDNELRVQTYGNGAIEEDSDGLYVNTDDESIVIEDNRLKANCKEKGGILSTSEGLIIDCGSNHNICFGVDSDGNWGYKKDGADAVIPFKTCEGVVTGYTNVSSKMTVTKGVNSYGNVWIEFAPNEDIKKGTIIAVAIKTNVNSYINAPQSTQHLSAPSGGVVWNSGSGVIMLYYVGYVKEDWQRNSSLEDWLINMNGGGNLSVGCYIGEPIIE